MGALGHVVGFCEDYQTVLHMHPAKESPASVPNPAQRMHFEVVLPRPGFARLFLQTKLEGRAEFSGFGIDVAGQ